MKKRFLVITFLFVISVKGQVFNSFGLQVGPALTNMKYPYAKDVFKTDDRAGLYLGLNGELLKKKYFSLRADIAYVQMGFKTDEIISSFSHPNGFVGPKDLRYDYIVFSPFVKLRYDYNHFSHYVLFGPYIGRCIKESVDFDPDFQEDLSRLKTAIGLNYGLGAMFQFSHLGLSLEIKRITDLSGIFKSDDKVYNEGIFITFGMNYSLSE